MKSLRPELEKESLLNKVKKTTNETTPPPPYELAP